MLLDHQVSKESQERVGFIIGSNWDLHQLNHSSFSCEVSSMKWWTVFSVVSASYRTLFFDKTTLDIDLKCPPFSPPPPPVSAVLDKRVHFQSGYWSLPLRHRDLWQRWDGLCFSLYVCEIPSHSVWAGGRGVRPGARASASEHQVLFTHRRSLALNMWHGVRFPVTAPVPQGRVTADSPCLCYFIKKEAETSVKLRPWESHHALEARSVVSALQEIWWE